MRLVEAVSEDQLKHIRELFREYADALNFNLCFQSFSSELDALPGEYASPSGRLLLAEVDGRAAGCVALRRIDPENCEMKRLFVRPEYRGRGIGRALALEIIRTAGSVGYSRMRLDSIDTMRSALNLYRSLGFKEIEAYRYNPIRGAVYMELLLVDRGKV